jgi:tetratricopeptide (TPR) repeat protein
MPFERNPRFTGREYEISKLENLFFQADRTTKVAITGLGGVGKTQLAIELVHRVMEKRNNCSVFWIPVTDQESLYQAYLAMAQKLSIPGWDKDGADLKHLVQQHLSKSSAGQWILVFDNADDINMWIQKPTPEQSSSRRLIDYLPQSTQGHIIFTTRDRKAAVKLASQNVIEVSEMNKESARELLKQCLINPSLANSNCTNDLLEQLTYLPLAVVQASAYINENGISITDYLSLLADKDESTIELLSEDFEDDGRYQNIKNPVATTWLVSFERISQRDPLAAEYLSFMACIEPKDIPESLLPSGLSQKKHIDAIGTLNAYSFITRRSERSLLDLHRLVHLATRNWLSENGYISEWTSKAIRRLAEVFPSSGYKNRSMWRSYLPHTIYALHLKNNDEKSENYVDLLSKVGTCLHRDGRYNEAESYLVEAMETRERVLGAEHHSTLTSVSNLASVLQGLGKYSAAEEMNQRALSGREKVLGVDHPDTLMSISKLASILRGQGKYSAAEEMNRRALSGREKVLGVDHPDTLMSVNNLASVLQDQGKYSAAEEMNRRALERREKVLGVDHPHTLTSVSDLALVLQYQGKYSVAEEMNRRALEGSKKVLGFDHPDTLVSVNNLASVLHDQGKYSAAEEMNQRALSGREKVLGVDHPDTLMSISRLASALQGQGKYSAAEEMNRRALAGREKVLGVDHPDTLTCVGNLALVLQYQGKYSVAEEMNRRALEGREKVLGVDHPDTLTCVGNLALVLQYQGKYSVAEEMNQRALSGREKVLGFDHPDTLMSVWCLASLFHQRKQYDSACDLYHRACQGFEVSLGKGHLTTVECRRQYLDALQEKEDGI